MDVKVKLISRTGRMPPGFDKWGDAVFALPNVATVSDLLAIIELKGIENNLTLVNGNPVPFSDRPDHSLADGDLVTVFPPIKGG